VTIDPEDAAGCPADPVLRLIWGEWITHILWVLGTRGPTRFGAIRRALGGGISAKVLTDRLRRLEADGLVRRDVAASKAPQVSYELTPRGRELDAALRSLHDLAARWRAEPPGGPD